MLHHGLMRRRPSVFGGLMIGLVTVASAGAGLAGPPPAHLKEHAITIDATKLVPASWWQVPGVTPSIYNSDPDSLDAPKTSERRELGLKPGKYKFISFTFDFPFVVNLEGNLEFAKSLDQCIEGRGTQTLVVRCTRIYPYGGERDAYYEQKP
jgi:hypothetical protein